MSLHNQHASIAESQYADFESFAHWMTCNAYVVDFPLCFDFVPDKAALLVGQLIPHPSRFSVSIYLALLIEFERSLSNNEN